MGAVVLVLGTAQDGGIPHAGCACPTCAAARCDPACRRLTASIAIVGETGRALVVDATPDFPAQLAELSAALDREPPALDALLITHAHMGHYLGLAYLGREGLDASTLPLYATESMTRFLGENRPWAHLVARRNVELRVLHLGEAFRFDGLDVTPFSAPHRAEDTDTVGVEVQGPSRRLLYLPDADRLTPDLVARIEAADVALVDGTFHDREELIHRDVEAIPHPFVVESVEVLSDAAGRVRFTHLNHTNRLLHPDPSRRASLPPGFLVLEDGEVFDL